MKNLLRAMVTVTLLVAQFQAEAASEGSINKLPAQAASEEVVGTRVATVNAY